MIEFLAANWLWIAAIVLVLAMHRGGHGCGMHGGHGHQHADHTRKTNHHQPNQTTLAERADNDHAAPTGGGRSTS